MKNVNTVNTVAVVVASYFEFYFEEQTSGPGYAVDK